MVSNVKRVAAETIVRSWHNGLFVRIVIARLRPCAATMIAPFMPLVLTPYEWKLKPTA
jgi:hypothetical protein